MGLQDKPDSKRMPGWYTAMSVTYTPRKKGNIEKIEKSANHLFDKRVQYLLAHPDEASWFSAPSLSVLGQREASSPSGMAQVKTSFSLCGIGLRPLSITMGPYISFS